MIFHYVFGKIGDYLEEHKDPRTADWLITQSAKPIFLIIICYIIFSTIIGPKLMEKRKPFKLKEVIISYNLFQCMLNIYFLYKIYRYSGFTLNNIFCHPITHTLKPEDIEMLHISWLILLNRFVEFADTLFFVLRKKNKNISALHIFHHASVPLGMWVGLKTVPTGHYYFGPTVNIFVHVVMYFYYFLAAFGPRFKKYLWWKRYLTQLQIVQFLILFLRDMYVFTTDCPVNHNLIMIEVFESAFFFVMFSNFYIKEYKTRNKSKLNVD